MRSRETRTASRLTAALALLLPVAATAATEKPQIKVEEVMLSNGMRWLLYEQHDSPTVAAGWTAHVGSVNEHSGITGISHFFEHMMFKGTKTIGTTNIEEDLKIIDEQERVREAMRAEMEVMRQRLREGQIPDLQNPENWTERYRELDKQFDALVQKERQIIVKDQMDQIYTANGGEFLNAFTTEDQTAYFVRLPSNRLELWAWLESDRLLNPVFREFYSERDVVFEERRMRTESTPLGKYDEAFNATFWEASPYKWPVVGWPSDIPMYTLSEAKGYFATYYAPNNITGILAGDFRTAEVGPLLERYFGRIPHGKVDPPPVVTMEPRHVAEKRFDASAETSPTVRVWWLTVPQLHKDTPALDLLSDVLSGRTGRLYKGLVQGRQIANAVEAAIDPRKYEGLFLVECTVKDGKEPAAVEQAVYEELEKLKREPVPAEELQKVKNAFKANAYRRMSTPFAVFMQLVRYDGTGDWRLVNEAPQLADATTAADLQRVAQQYLGAENRTVGIFLRKEGGAPEDKELASLPQQAQAMVRQASQQIAAEKDPARLREMIEKMQQAAAQVPPEMKPAAELVLKRAQERLQSLSGEKK
ncbi:MAG TPA: pitrilysin family protein [Vicinamibacteria bacterium]|nr:pitrilysin family protein [Vicinamibacteria bacterium]